MCLLNRDIRSICLLSRDIYSLCVSLRNHEIQGFLRKTKVWPLGATLGTIGSHWGAPGSSLGAPRASLMPPSGSKCGPSGSQAAPRGRQVKPPKWVLRLAKSVSPRRNNDFRIKIFITYRFASQIDEFWGPKFPENSRFLEIHVKQKLLFVVFQL